MSETPGDRSEMLQHDLAERGGETEEDARQRRADILSALAAKYTQEAQVAPTSTGDALPQMSRPMLSPRILGMRPTIYGIASGVILTLIIGLITALSLTHTPMDRLFEGNPFAGSSPQSSGVDQPLAVAVDVPWTTIQVDGRPINVSPTDGVFQLLAAPGRHSLQWQASPFLPQRCTFSLPYALSDTCPIAAAGALQNPTGGTTKTLHLHESLATLSSQHYQALTSAIQAAFDALPAEPVQPGDHLLFPPPTATIVRAQLHLQLDATASGALTANCQLDIIHSGVQPCMLNSENCFQMCIMPWQSRQARFATEWQVLAPVQLEWRYLDAQNRLLAHALLAGGPGVADHLIALSIRFDAAGWNVTPLLGPLLPSSIITGDNLQVADDPACAAAEDFIEGDGTTNYTQLRFVSGANPSAGCLVVATLRTARGVQQANSSAQLLERFGTLYTVDAGAHQTWPQLPHADAFQQQVTTQLAALTGQSVTLGQ